LHQNCDYCNTPASLFTRSGPSRLLSVPKIKRPIQRKRFDDVEAIKKKKSLEELKSIPEEDFQRAFLQWKRRWEKCIATQGEYFEGDTVL